MLVPLAGLVHDGGVPALEGAMLRVLDAGVPIVAQLVVCVLLGVGGVGQNVCLFRFSVFGLVL
jgi:hypothetical protein